MTFDITTELLNHNNRQRKRKKYVLFLYNSKQVREGDLKMIERVVASFDGLTLAKLEEPDEVLRILLIKNIDLLILDESFLQDQTLTIQFAKEIKRRRKCPILFLTSQEHALIQEYRNHLFLYEELDDYLTCPMDFSEAAKRLRRTLAVEGRASKRFTVNAEVQIFRIDTQSTVTGTLTDLSLMGFGFAADTPQLFKKGEQLQMRISLGHFGVHHPHIGEFLKVAGKIRRVAIDGKNMGCSLEHLTPLQTELLTQVLETVVKRMRQFKLASQQVKKSAAY